MHFCTINTQPSGIYMKLTQEQYDIVHSTGIIKINAVAGSGKTTTIIEYAKARPRSSRILYLAFNKSVKLEALRKLREEGLPNVTVETAHSLAFRYIVAGSQYQVKKNCYRTNEIASILDLKGNSEQHEKYILANHINKFITYFCNSDKRKMAELNYFDLITDGKAQAFVMRFYSNIQNQTRIFLNKMDTNEIEVTHDFYLKKFQLSNPVLPYDYILFDEGQDASPAMLDVFLNQKAVKVIVGDTHQQIYSWRHAVNSLKSADFKTFSLSASFRFSPVIANLAMEVLKRKRLLDEEFETLITGAGVTNKIKSRAVIARTNIGLLVKAIEYVIEKNKLKDIYFEENINSYIYADEGASLYDILNLRKGNRNLIKDKLIQEFKSMNDLEEYIKKTEDSQLAVMLEIVKEYGDEIPVIIKTIKEKHITGDCKENAQMIFSTVHKCKGMEYDAVQIANDFMTEEKLEKLISDDTQPLNNTKLIEEINLLYVAITRSKYRIHIPEDLMPADFPHSPQIHVMTETSAVYVKEIQESKMYKLPEKQLYNEISTTWETARETNLHAYEPWTPELDDELTIMYCEGVTVKAMAKHFGRSKGAILSRITKLELEVLYG